MAPQLQRCALPDLRLARGGTAGLLDKARLSLALGDHEMIVVAITAPRSGRDITHFHKLPVGHISRAEPKIIAHCRRDIETGAVIQVRLRSLILKNVLEMVGAKRSAIFPLGIANATAFADGQPAVFANRMARFGVSSPKPWNHQRRFRFELSVRDVVIRKSAIKRVLPGGK